MTTKILKLSDNGDVTTELYYSLPPKKALICAYEQDRGNNNTWDYDFNSPKYKHDNAFGIIDKGKFGLMLGNFWVKY